MMLENSKEQKIFCVKIVYDRWGDWKNNFKTKDPKMTKIVSSTSKLKHNPILIKQQWYIKYHNIDVSNYNSLEELINEFNKVDRRGIKYPTIWYDNEEDMKKSMKILISLIPMFNLNIIKNNKKYLIENGE